MRSSRSVIGERDQRSSFFQEALLPLVEKDTEQTFSFNRLRRAWRSFWNSVWYKNSEISFEGLEDSSANTKIISEAAKYQEKRSSKNREDLITALDDAEKELENPLTEAATFGSYVTMLDNSFRKQSENAKDPINIYQARKNSLQQKRGEFLEKFKEDDAANKSRPISSLFLNCFAMFSPCKTGKPTSRNATPSTHVPDAPQRMSMK